MVYKLHTHKAVKKYGGLFSESSWLAPLFFFFVWIFRFLFLCFPCPAHVDFHASQFLITWVLILKRVLGEPFTEFTPSDLVGALPTHLLLE